MGNDRRLRLNMTQPNIFSHLIDYGLSGRLVFARGQIRPAGKMHLKTPINIKLWRIDLNDPFM